ncbi:hypothetical protein CPT_Sansa120 [Caulobacter phage Sansa]|uniref:Uncharacterized protein n=1 Tax=Caulobacter phage Sansa TaxID=1675600 RepID=A0A0K1LLR1_9CAUD|nr:hypothetical protein HOR07_gp005 [Caulobacter phage Sansa]YP_009785508.1 hypothetical protein HOR07_gp120 [Caulobacter phage Sansa]AKU43409.1 hypothetical protein CPT_Sansa5 [Caulobacter phage Sansa]AKU43524.1 hypothetical protein CPT_Sansa120 [Caulobacter phage Sansa]
MEARSASRLLARAERELSHALAALALATSEAARARHERRVMVAQVKRQSALFDLRRMGAA